MPTTSSPPPVRASETIDEPAPSGALWRFVNFVYWLSVVFTFGEMFVLGALLWTGNEFDTMCKHAGLPTLLTFVLFVVAMAFQIEMKDRFANGYPPHGKSAWTIAAAVFIVCVSACYVVAKAAPTQCQLIQRPESRWHDEAATTLH